MADDEKPTSLWKQDVSFRRQPDESLEERVARDPELDATLSALADPVEPVAMQPEPAHAPAEAPAPAIEHGWLTQPLEEVSEPPAELSAPVSFAPEQPVPVAPMVVEPTVVEPVALEPAPAPGIPIVPLPGSGLEPELDLALALPAAVLPEHPVEPAWPAEAALEEPTLVADPDFELEPKVPFYKRQISLSVKPRQPKEPKAAKPKREQKEEPEGGDKVPFYKRELSFKRGPKEWDAGEGLTEEAPKPRPKLRRPPRPRPSLPSLSRGGGGGNQLVGLKIGGSQIAAARVRNGESPELLQAARVPLDHGIVVNGELRDPEALAVALKAFFAKHKLPKRGVRLGIANNRIGVRTFEVTGIDDPKQLANAIRFRAQEVLPIPLEEAVLDYQVLSESRTKDGQPLRRVLLVVAYRELVDRYVYACRKAGLQIVGIDLEAFALLRAVAAPLDSAGEHERGALVAVSVGHDRSTFAVSDGRVCEFTRVLEWGGWALNVAIARALDMSPSEVEPLKRALSFTASTEVPERFTEEQLATAREASLRQLQTFARELVSSLQFYQNQPGSLGIGEIALTGGTAHLPGLGGELSRLIGVPVHVVDPLSRVRVSKKVQEREQVGSLAVAIGLGIED
jgi:type IV pilus assembly protein PilM